MKMAHITKDIGNRAHEKDMVGSSMLMGIFIQDIGLMIKLTDKGNFTTTMAQCTKACLRKERKMGMAQKIIQMALHLKGSSQMDRKRVREYYNGLMAPYTMENFLEI